MLSILGKTPDRKTGLSRRASVALFFSAYMLAVFLGWACVSRTDIGSPASLIRVMTFNIRYDEPLDGENAWPRRREMVAGTISFFSADIVGLQEALISQVRDLEALLPDFSWIGVGRDDGQEGGEFCPIFYLRNRLHLLDSGTFWLSESPDQPGLKGWDAACARIVTWARFRDVRNGSILIVFNTHFDHVGETARVESAHLLRRKIAEISDSNRIVVSGDFNCTERDPPYSILLSSGGELPVLKDARIVSRLSPYGSSYSSNRFRPEPQPGRLIDYIFVGASVSVLRWGVISDRWDGRFVSDHNPVLAEIRLGTR
jgi:endonuclease/exonuclease/phosphatase family metal-dependent hydrolase